MNPMSEKKLEKLLRQAPSGGDLDRAVQGVIARAERDGLIDVAYATVDSPFGTLLVARTERGVVRLALPKHRGDQRSEDEVLEDLARFVSPRVLESPTRLDEERRELDAAAEPLLGFGGAVPVPDLIQPHDLYFPASSSTMRTR